MIVPAYLQKGDTICIVATARKISLPEIQHAISVFENQGLVVKLGKHLFDNENQFAGSDKNRANDLQEAIHDASIKAIVIARGGYGTVRLLEHVDFTPLLKNPKWIIGYSDVTVLHSALHKIGIASLHATMPINFDKNKEATDSLVNALFNQYHQIKAESFFTNKLGKSKGQLVGGNLSLLYALSGTPYDIDTAGKILFIEDLDEYLYHIDRMMMQLKLAGKLKNLAGLVVGGMSDMKDNTIPFGKMAEDIILDAVKEYDYPVCFEFPAGHIDRNLALYFGKEIELIVENDDVTLTYLNNTKP